MLTNPEGGSLRQGGGACNPRALLDGAGGRFDNRRVTHRIASFVLCWAAVSLLSTWSPTPTGAAPDGAITVQVAPLEGPAVEGRLAALDGSKVTLATAAGDRTFALEAVRHVRRSTATEPPPEALGHLRVTLTGGEVLLGTYAGATADGFALQTRHLGRVALMLEVIASVASVPADAGLCFAPEDRLPQLADDVAYTRSGDQVTGIVLAVDDRGFEIETAVRSRVRRVAWDELKLLRLQNDPAPPSSELRVEIETLDGTRFEAAGEVAAEGEALVCGLRSAPTTRVKVPWRAIHAIRPSGKAFVYASTLPFESTLVWFYPSSDDPIYQGYLEWWYGARVDRRPQGCPLRLAGRVYRHGFAVQSRSTITIATGKAWKRFETLVGVDDHALDVAKEAEVAEVGIIDARVLGDGKVLWEAKGIRVGETPRHVGPLDVSTVDSLVLEVDFGASKVVESIGDRATWADPMLFR